MKNYCKCPVYLANLSCFHRLDIRYRLELRKKKTTQREKMAKFGYLPKNGVKKSDFAGKIWANGTKRVFILVSVSPKDMESV